MLETRIIKIRHHLLCFLCYQSIEGSEALRLRWNSGRVGVALLGYFHPHTCGTAMEAVLREGGTPHVRNIPKTTD